MNTPHTTLSDPARLSNRAEIIQLSRTLMMRIQNEGQTRYCKDCRYDIDRRMAQNHRRMNHKVED